MGRLVASKSVRCAVPSKLNSFARALTCHARWKLSDVMWCEWCDVMWCYDAKSCEWCDVMWCESCEWCNVEWCDVMWSDVSDVSDVAFFSGVNQNSSESNCQTNLARRALRRERTQWRIGWECAVWTMDAVCSLEPAEVDLILGESEVDVCDVCDVCDVWIDRRPAWCAIVPVSTGGVEAERVGKSWLVKDEANDSECSVRWDLICPSRWDRAYQCFVGWGDFSRIGEFLKRFTAQMICGLSWWLLFDDCVWWLCLMTVFDACVWWLCLMAVFDDCVWWLCLITVFDDCVWWLCLMPAFDDCVWWLCLMTVFDDCVWWLCLMTVFDDCVFGNCVWRLFWWSALEMF